ncbi:MAG: type II 3-dehydroquinate dehydratase [Acidimicrobiales bacterium]
MTDQGGPARSESTDSRWAGGVILLLSGPNLSLLGRRQPEIYGRETLADHEETARQAADHGGYRLEVLQSDHEGELVEAIHGARGRCAGVIINAGALSHSSWSLHDALAAFPGPSVELHLSNPAAREPFRHRSVLAPVVDGSVAGFGGLGYRLAVEAIIALVGTRGQMP